MFDDWLASNLCDYRGDTITVETDIARLRSVEGRLVTVQPAYLALAAGDRLIVLRAEHVVALLWAVFAFFWPLGAAAALLGACAGVTIAMLINLSK